MELTPELRRSLGGDRPIGLTSEELADVQRLKEQALADEAAEAATAKLVAVAVTPPSAAAVPAPPW